MPFDPVFKASGFSTKLSNCTDMAVLPKDVNLKEDRGHAMNQILEWENLLTLDFFTKASDLQPRGHGLITGRASLQMQNNLHIISYHQICYGANPPELNSALHTCT